MRIAAPLLFTRNSSAFYTFPTVLRKCHIHPRSYSLLSICAHVGNHWHASASRRDASTSRQSLPGNWTSTSLMVNPRRYLTKGATGDERYSVPEPGLQMTISKPSPESITPPSVREPPLNKESPTHKPKAADNISKEHKESRASTPSPESTTVESKIPTPIMGYPTHIITRSKFDKYIKPLYQMGWSIEYRYGKTEDNEYYPVPSLQLHFGMLDWKRFLILGEIVRALEKSEEHPVEWKYTSSSAGMDFKRLRELGLDLPPSITLILRTRNAILPSTPRALTKPDESFSHLPPALQGITLRDIRFAMLLNELLTKHNSESSKPASRIVTLHWQDVNDNSLQPRSVDALILGPMEPRSAVKDSGQGEKVIEHAFYIGNGWEDVLDEP